MNTPRGRCAVLRTERIHSLYFVNKEKKELKVLMEKEEFKEKHGKKTDVRRYEVRAGSFVTAEAFMENKIRAGKQ